MEANHVQAEDAQTIKHGQADFTDGWRITTHSLDEEIVKRSV